jgi:hypothetical protein
MLRAILLLGGCFGFASTAYADLCTVSSSVATSNTILSVASISDAPAGTPLGPWAITSLTYSCTSDISGSKPPLSFSALYPSLGSSAAGHGTYIDSDGVNYTLHQTAVPGISIVIAAKNAAGQWVNVGNDSGTGIDATTYIAEGVQTGPLATQVKTRYIADAPNNITLGQAIMPRAIDFSSIAFHSHTVQTNSPVTENSTKAPINFSTLTIPVTNCSINNPNIMVQLPTVTTNDINKSGQGLGLTPFALNVNCPANVDIYMALTDATNPSNTTTTLTTKTGNGFASGVALQILKEGKAISFGQGYGDGNNLISAFAKQNTQIKSSINLAAQYIKTGAPVTAGTVQGMATIYFLYQ